MFFRQNYLDFGWLRNKLIYERLEGNTETYGIRIFIRRVNSFLNSMGYKVVYCNLSNNKNERNFLVIGKYLKEEEGLVKRNLIILVLASLMCIVGTTIGYFMIEYAYTLAGIGILLLIYNILRKYGCKKEIFIVVEGETYEKRKILEDGVAILNPCIFNIHIAGDVYGSLEEFDMEKKKEEIVKDISTLKTYIKKISRVEREETKLREDITKSRIKLLEKVIEEL